MKTSRFAWLLVAVAIMGSPVSLQAKKPHPPEATPIDVPIPKGAVHIVIKAGDEELRQVFTFFPYPPLPTDGRTRMLPLIRSGVYRIEVNPNGDVAAVTILKTMGRSMDFSAMKTFVRWKAKPGPLRVVDVTFTFWTRGASRRPFW